jgi:hypothetical protein
VASQQVEQYFCAGHQAGYVIGRLVDGPAITNTLAADSDDCGAAGRMIDHPVRRCHSPPRPDDVAAMPNFMVVEFPWHIAAIGHAVADQPNPFSAVMLESDQAVGTALGEEGEKGGLNAAHLPAPARLPVQ